MTTATLDVVREGAPRDLAGAIYWVTHDSSLQSVKQIREMRQGLSCLLSQFKKLNPSEVMDSWPQDEEIDPTDSLTLSLERAISSSSRNREALKSLKKRSNNPSASLLREIDLLDALYAETLDLFGEIVWKVILHDADASPSTGVIKNGDDFRDAFGLGGEEAPV